MTDSAIRLAGIVRSPGNAPTPAPGRHRGFTLIELMMVIAIVAILGLLAMNDYRYYIMRGEASQTLYDYGHIRTVIAVEFQADGLMGLAEGSAAGQVPPKLDGLLDPRVFNGLDGQKFQLVVVPAGTFASYPTQDVYGLIDTVTTDQGQQRLRILRKALPHVDGDKIWLSDSQLLYPVDPGSGESGNSGPGGSAPLTPPSPPPVTPPPPPPPPPPGNGNSNITGDGTSNGPTWTANVNICVGAASGGALTGYNNVSVRYQVTTKYSAYTEDLQISSSTGCVSKSYPSQPSDGSFSVQVLGVVNYTVSSSEMTPLWDGKKPSLTIPPPK